MELRGARVAVTGATGFLGRYIVDALLARGAKVIGVVRNPGRVPELAARGVEMRRADLADRAGLVEGFRGADAVVSNAALFSIGNRDWAQHQSANVEGTANVMDAAADAGVHRVVHVSSVAVYRSRSGTSRPIDEDHAQWSASDRRTFSNAYPMTKALSEQRAWEIARARDIALTTVRPCAIYGAFDPNFTRLIRRALSGPIGPAPAFLHLPLVYAGDVALAACESLARDESAGRAYNTTGDDLPFREFLAAWVKEGGRVPRVMLPLPLPVKVRYDHGRAARDLGFQNRSFEEALRETFAKERAGA